MYTDLVALDVETFVTIHDQDLVLECIDSGKFKDVDPTYLFVGSKPVDRIPPTVKLVVCRDYTPNVEQLPHFYDFTGWYVLGKHGLIKTDDVVFLQYDHSIHDCDLIARTSSMLGLYPMVAYVPATFDMWTLQLSGFYEQQVAGVRRCGADWSTLLVDRPFTLWPCTQGTAWRTSAFTEFMEWFEPSFDQFKDHELAGHLAERMIQPFLMTKGWEAGYLPGLVAHESLDCHGTGDLLRGNTAQYASKAQAFGR